MLMHVCHQSDTVHQTGHLCDVWIRMRKHGGRYVFKKLYPALMVAKERESTTSMFFFEKKLVSSKKRGRYATRILGEGIFKILRANNDTAEMHNANYCSRSRS